MHEPVIDNLEAILGGGRLGRAAEEHLTQCASCREEVAAMRSQHDLFAALKSPAEIEPAAGFYARVMNRIESQARPSVWSLFGESLFAKRLAYASMTFVLLLGSYALSSTRSDGFVVDGPEAILAAEDSQMQSDSSDAERNRERMLVTLATYEE